MIENFKYHPLAKIKVELIEKGRRKHDTHSLGQKNEAERRKNKQIYKRYSKIQWLKKLSRWKVIKNLTALFSDKNPGFGFLKEQWGQDSGLKVCTGYEGCNLLRAFSHDLREAKLMFQNNRTAAMLVYQENPLGFELFSHVNAFFCSNKLA